MNIAILGGTSHVASELCLVLREWGHSVTPTARSRVSASFLNDQNFDPVFGDITNRGTVQQAVDDADVIAIAAFARQYSKGFAPREAHKTNKAIVENAVLEAPEDASLIYFSTIAVYSDATGFNRFDSYAVEKRRVERSFLKACDDHNKNGYVFRIGPVYGPNQGNTHELRAKISRKTRDNKLHINVDSDRLSNVVHTVTIADSIIEIHAFETIKKVFTIVNKPQWTWCDVFEHYTPNTTKLVFHPREGGGTNDLFQKAISFGSNMLESNERSLRSLSVYFPARVNRRIFNEYVKRKAHPNLASFDSRWNLELSQFDQKSVPGDRVPELSYTKNLIRETDEISDLADRNGIETRSTGSIVQF